MANVYTPPEFPIMQPRTNRANLRTGIPWGLIRAHDYQAFRNHMQSLDQLADRGGLSPDEAVAVLEDRRWRQMDATEANQRLSELVADWELSQRGIK